MSNVQSLRSSAAEAACKPFLCALNAGKWLMSPFDCGNIKMQRETEEQNIQWFTTIKRCFIHTSKLYNATLHLGQVQVER